MLTLQTLAVHNMLLFAPATRGVMFEKGQCRGGLMLTVIYSRLRCYFTALLRRLYQFALLMYIWVDVNIKLYSVRRAGAMYIFADNAVQRNPSHQPIELL